jgi:chromosome segregation ATPase
VNKGVTVMTDSKNVLNVENWSGNTDELEKQLEATKEKLHFSRTMAERQRLVALQNEVSSDFKRVKELRSKAYEVAIANQSRIKSLNEEVEKLRLESVDITIESWQLENNLKIKRSEMWQLEKAIADDKITG